MDAELIIILVAVGLSILSGINKRRKKKAEHQHHNEYPETGHVPEDDPWSTIRKYIEDAHSDGQTPPERTMQESRVENSPVQAQPSVRKVAPEKANRYTSSLNEYAAMKQASAPAGQKKKRIHAPEQTPVVEPEVATSPFLEDFDLRKAVVYSEILKPKYDEF